MNKCSTFARRAAALLAIALAGCGGDPGATDPTLVVIEGPRGNILRAGVDSSESGRVDDVAVVVNHGQLRLNGKSYGKVEPGNKVKIDTEGKVFINGASRAPAAAN
jgi:hypothetical protein